MTITKNYLMPAKFNKIIYSNKKNKIIFFKYFN